MDYIVYDLEANSFVIRSKGSREKRRSEIIEIAACKLRLIDGQLEVVDHFQSVVKPIEATRISNFIRDLTGLHQEDVDCCDTMDVVLPSFIEWLGNDYIMITWGNWDKKLLYQACDKLEMSSSWFKDKHIDIQIQFTKILESKDPIGLKKVLEHFKIEPFGDSHSAIGDSFNLSQVIQQNFHLLDFSNTLSNGTKRSLLQSSI